MSPRFIALGNFPPEINTKLNKQVARASLRKTRTAIKRNWIRVEERDALTLRVKIIKNFFYDSPRRSLLRAMKRSWIGLSGKVERKTIGLG